MADTKKLIVALASKIPPPGKKSAGRDAAAKDDAEDDGDDKLMGLESVMGDFLKAQKAGDTAGMAMAFKEAHEICTSYED